MSARVRWIGYALALALVLWAARSLDTAETAPIAQPTARAATSLGHAGPAATLGAQVAGLALPPARGLAAPAGDPFAGPLSGAATAAAAGRAASRPIALPTGAPAAPPLPFAVLGRWTEHGRSFVFLQRGEQSFKVQQAGPLDGDYAVVAMDEHRIALRYLPLGVVQELRLDVPAPPVRALAAQESAPAAPESDKADN